jgi:lysophospholipase L1-like esterase
MKPWLLLAAVPLLLAGGCRCGNKADPPAVPENTPLVSFGDNAIAPDPIQQDEIVDGVQVSTLVMEPSRTYSDMEFPDFPLLVPQDGRLPTTRRVLYYSPVVNERGLRGKEVYSFASSPDRYRIGILGTGVTFGEGVTHDQTFVKLLEEHLNERPPSDRTFEVINFGVPCMTANLASGTFVKHNSAYAIDLWLIAIGVNDSLPMFNRTEEDFLADIGTLVDTVQAAGAEVIFVREPANTFYPWMEHYVRYQSVFDAQVGDLYEVLDLSATLDCHERRSGLRLEVQGDDQRMVQYRDGVPRELYRARYRAEGEQQFISPEIYAYFETRLVHLHTFITDVHLNPRGHEIVAEILYDVVAARIQGKPAPERQECALLEP